MYVQINRYIMYKQFQLIYVTIVPFAYICFKTYNKYICERYRFELIKYFNQKPY